MSRCWGNPVSAHNGGRWNRRLVDRSPRPRCRPCCGPASRLTGPGRRRRRPDPYGGSVDPCPQVNIQPATARRGSLRDPAFGRRRHVVAHRHDAQQFPRRRRAGAGGGLVDAMPCRGAAWLDTARMVVRLIRAGHTQPKPRRGPSNCQRGRVPHRTPSTRSPPRADWADDLDADLGARPVDGACETVTPPARQTARAHRTSPKWPLPAAPGSSTAYRFPSSRMASTARP